MNKNLKKWVAGLAIGSSMLLAIQGCGLESMLKELKGI